MVTFIFCLDDNGGMMFGGRRQSRDARVFDDIRTVMAETGAKLYILPYSEKLIAEAGLEHETVASFESVAGDAICFVENVSVRELLKTADKIVFYRWNRKYPSDFKVDFKPDECGFKLSSTSDFAGKSHDKITKEVWIK